MRVMPSLLAIVAALPLAAPVSAQGSSKDGRHDVDIVELLTRFAKRSGKQFVIDPRVRSQVPLAGLDADQLTYDQLLTILDVHQVAVVDAGGVLSVVPDANARQHPGPVHTDVRFQARDHERVTLLVQPKNVCAAFMVPVLRPLMPQAAHLAAEIQSNTLIINDQAVNARRIAELVEQLDRRGGGRKDCPSAGMGQAAPATPAPSTAKG